MPIYETVFMARQDLSEKQVKELTDKYKDVIKSEKGKVLKEENWGLRTLAYRINKSRKAHYVLLETDIAGEGIIEVERLMRLDEDVMRSQTLKLEEPTKGPSAIIDKSGRDDDRKDDRKDKKEAA
ncbi:MAG: 30S ribosomal protein S6 [Pseudomonadota bacterium]